MAQLSHAIVFDVISDREDASDVTPQMLKDALLKRIADPDASFFPGKGRGWEWPDAVGAPCQ